MSERYSHARKPATTPPYTHIDSRTLGRALDRLLEHTRKRVMAGARAAGTLKMHKHHAQWIARQLGADLPIEDITSAWIFELSETWLASGGRDGKPIGLKTLAKRLSTLRRALRLEAQRGEIAAVPLFPEIGMPPMRPRARILESHADLVRLCDSLPPERAEWVHLAVWSCQRPGDVERMAWPDVDLRAKPPTMLIRSTKTRKPWGIKVPMPAPLVRVLLERLARLARLGRSPAPNDPIVASWPSRSHLLPIACVRIGLPPMSAMDLRHTGFSWMIRRRGITWAAQEWSGWSDFAMLARYYAHALPPQLADASRELASIVGRSHRRAPSRTSPHTPRRRK